MSIRARSSECGQARKLSVSVVPSRTVRAVEPSKWMKEIMVVVLPTPACAGAIQLTFNGLAIYYAAVVRMA